MWIGQNLFPVVYASVQVWNRSCKQTVLFLFSSVWWIKQNERGILLTRRSSFEQHGMCMRRLHYQQQQMKSAKIKFKRIFMVACLSLSIHHNSLHFPTAAETGAWVESSCLLAAAAIAAVTVAFADGKKFAAMHDKSEKNEFFLWYVLICWTVHSTMFNFFGLDSRRIASERACAHMCLSLCVCVCLFVWTSLLQWIRHVRWRTYGRCNLVRFVNVCAVTAYSWAFMLFFPLFSSNAHSNCDCRCKNVIIIVNTAQ